MEHSPGLVIDKGLAAGEGVELPAAVQLARCILPHSENNSLDLEITRPHSYGRNENALLSATT